MSLGLFSPSAEMLGVGGVREDIGMHLHKYNFLWRQLCLNGELTCTFYVGLCNISTMIMSLLVRQGDA